jgi:hypothetical protein
MKDTDNAFPGSPGFSQEGMTLPQYAAIKLRVPRSGDPQLDAWIRESRRADFMTASIGGLLSSTDHWVDADVAEKFAEQAAGMADAMLEIMEKREKNHVKG